MHQSLQGATFHVEHIIPRSRGGLTQLDNLAWACPSCNLHKSNRIEIAELHTGVLVPLFHPRTDTWNTHFRWEDYHIVGHTPIGRATVSALDLNHPRRLQIRQAEELFDLFPPQEVSERREKIGGFSDKTALRVNTCYLVLGPYYLVKRRDAVKFTFHPKVPFHRKPAKCKNRKIMVKEKSGSQKSGKTRIYTRSG